MIFKYIKNKLFKPAAKPKLNVEMERKRMDLLNEIESLSVDSAGVFTYDLIPLDKKEK